MLQIARWYCPESHTTFSLLPECLAARFPGELDEVEAVVAYAERAPSLAGAANELRRDAVELPGAMRWVGRRVRLVHHVLGIVIGLLPEQLARCIAEMGAVRTRLHTETALRALRTLVAEQLPALPAPLGFRRASDPCRVPVAAADQLRGDVSGNHLPLQTTKLTPDNLLRASLLATLPRTAPAHERNSWYPVRLRC